ncbi:MAG: hypothetical protein A2725_03200 [Candidatus Magasanikbacteria bacterium RIFCSPHIGHO2_01_FULL_33_34]|uniref:Uncharacterized protein n=1 Tax=Candidatus Magasanikbacteria bacterium RIFCSPHIGHO2_01_FULL_33_34 TaxID=1798671 RepID=A0A1F6LGT9_9BACT|nr:MAG: hypothetical protein A2725_03200 [Candidatus Magasanikbacteria bacterium RIFCSPHIGHO2_01_FULL_33_34]OGH66137.1 MAG: hypothetical protein A3B83_00690 [Candidatus Magasanikbacteria bacterium RIFCSPHIGHO2_02_FULL_33_17]OGH75983.1 MAG: hypothetical protein A3A89_00600 [Candidatus Magasanikbacteria bacterium RIFCSPLOWO2_01_FULL_33_34]OGH81575.1 MAG: hypothetical protein A3F93_03375 [Candidatus Magasanikbacteria bacterium RIFCSPLOWO2_12_FULL_34_7]
MPVKKRKNNEADNEMKERIKNTIEELPKIIAEEMRENKKEKKLTKNSTPYNDPSYKKRKLIMWSFVIVFILIIFTMWAININSVFYDFNKKIQNDDSLSNINKGKEIIQETYDNNIKNVFDKFDTLIEDSLEEKATEKENNNISLESLVNAINNFTSTTINTTSSTDIIATSTMDTTTTTEEVPNKN